MIKNNSTKKIRKLKIYKKKQITKKHKLTTKKKTLRINGGAEDDTCPICFELITNVNAITTRCGHTFHKECIIQTCKTMYWNKNNECICPICRGNINTQIKNLLPPEEQFDPNKLTLETFPLYINYILSSSPEDNPDNTLLDVLYSFDGLDTLPIDVHDPIVNEDGTLIPNIMEFKKLNVATRLSDRKPLYIYYFNGFIHNKPRNMFTNKKYFIYTLDEDGITHLEEL